MKWFPKIALAASLAAAGLALPAAGQVGSRGSERQGGEADDGAKRGGVQERGQGAEEKPAGGAERQGADAGAGGGAGRGAERRANQGDAEAGGPNAPAGTPRKLSREGPSSSCGGSRRRRTCTASTWRASSG
jgi:hypothetical protein